MDRTALAAPYGCAHLAPYAGLFPRRCVNCVSSISVCFDELLAGNPTARRRPYGLGWHDSDNFFPIYAAIAIGVWAMELSIYKLKSPALFDINTMVNFFLVCAEGGLAD